MPNEIEAKWQIYPEDGGFQLHKLTHDGAKGEAVGPKYPKRADALKYQRTLYSNSPDVASSEKDDVLTITGNVNVGLSNGVISSQALHAIGTAAKARDLPSGMSASTTNFFSGAIHFVADDANPRILHFKNVVLARPETNKNYDNISEQGIKELAESIAMMPIDANHDVTKNLGFFTAGRVGEHGELRVDGTIWLDRCEENGVDPKDILKEEYGLSIESSAEVAECSKCHKSYTDARQYCEHIKIETDDKGNSDMGIRSKIKHGAARLMKGLRATGGAFTRKPAGTNCGWDAFSMITFIASHQEQDMGESQNELEAIEKREDVSPADKKRAVEEYGDVEYADPANRRYPIESEKHVRSALAYLSMPKNASKYSPEEVKIMMGKIKRAAKKFGIEVSDTKNEGKAMSEKDEKEKDENVDAPEKDKEKEVGLESMLRAECDKLQAVNADLNAKIERALAKRTEAEQKYEATLLQLSNAQTQLRSHRVSELRAKFVASTVMDEQEFNDSVESLLGLPDTTIDVLCKGRGRNTEEPKQKMTAAVETTLTKHYSWV